MIGSHRQVPQCVSKVDGLTCCVFDLHISFFFCEFSYLFLWQWTTSILLTLESIYET